MCALRFSQSAFHAASDERRCARICARMTMFLLVLREDESLGEKTRFPLVNQLFFEMKSAVLKSMISES